MNSLQLVLTCPVGTLKLMWGAVKKVRQGFFRSVTAGTVSLVENVREIKILRHIFEKP